MTISRMSAALVLAILVASPVRAEVSAETDPTGVYLRTVVFANASVKNVKIWTVSRLKVGFTPLNPQGDATGDLWPFIAEDPFGDRLPWVVWSRFNGHDFDLVWSRWTGASWSGIASVETGNSDDGLSPNVSFDVTGRPHLVWLSAGEGPKAVYLSIFLTTRWMLPFRVSDPWEDATNPTVVVSADGTIRVSYTTASGEVDRWIRFFHPSTITDDITPFSSLAITDTSVSPQMSN